MKWEILLGFYHTPNIGETMMGHLFLHPVEFPMQMQGGVAHNREEMRRIADEDFEEWEIREWTEPNPLYFVLIGEPKGDGEIAEFVGAFTDPEHVNFAEEEYTHRAFGETNTWSISAHDDLDEWREEAEMRGVLGDDDRIDE